MSSYIKFRKVLSILLLAAAPALADEINVFDATDADSQVFQQAVQMQVKTPIAKKTKVQPKSPTENSAFDGAATADRRQKLRTVIAEKQSAGGPADPKRLPTRSAAAISREGSVLPASVPGGVGSGAGQVNRLPPNSVGGSTTVMPITPKTDQ